MWDKGSLHELIEAKITDYPMIVVANREPFIHYYEGGGETIACQRPASGMASALDPVMRASGGVWVGHGSGDADRAMVDEFDRVRVPPEDPSYTLRQGVADQGGGGGLLPRALERGALAAMPCHVHPPGVPARALGDVSPGQPALRRRGARRGRRRPAFVFIQDYHFALLPRYLKERNPNLIIAQFWHIPWPNRETFRVFPWKEELLDGLLGNDLLGFHLRYHCQNFLEAVDRTIEARIDQEQGEIVRGGKSTLVRPFPISIDFERQEALAESHEVEQEIVKMRAPARPSRRHPGHRHRTDRLHQGNPRAVRGARPLLRAVPGIPRAAHVRAGRRAQPRAHRLPTSRLTRRSIAWSSSSTGNGERRAGARWSTSSAISRRSRWPPCIASPISASSARFTTE